MSVFLYSKIQNNKKKNNHSNKNKYINSSTPYLAVILKSESWFVIVRHEVSPKNIIYQLVVCGKSKIYNILLAMFYFEIGYNIHINYGKYSSILSKMPSIKRFLKFLEFRFATSSLFFKSPVSISTPGTGDD